MDHLLGFGFNMTHVATSATDIRTIILVQRFRNSCRRPRTTFRPIWRVWPSHEAEQNFW